MVTTTLHNYTITFLCLVGLALSIYAYIVELQLENDANYEPMCDIGPHISCTKAFRSPYGKGFGFVGEDSFFYKPNSLVGIFFYSVSSTLAQSNSLLIAKVSYFGWMLSNLASLYFAYILYFKLYDFCIVCVSTYVVNALALLVTNRKLRTLSIESQKKRN